MLGLTFRALSVASANTMELLVRHPHHMVGDTVRLLLVWVPRRIDRQFHLRFPRPGGVGQYRPEVVSEAIRRSGSRPGFNSFSLRLDQRLRSLISNLALQIQDWIGAMTQRVQPFRLWPPRVRCWEPSLVRQTL
jgi:hypothetical protein